MRYVLYFLFWIVVFYLVIKFGISTIEDIENKKDDSDAQKEG